MLRTEIVERDGAIILELSGEIALAGVESLDRAFMTVIERRPKQVVIDLASVSLVTSLGMGRLVQFRNGMKKNKCDVVLAAMRPMVRGAFDRARISELFQIAPTANDAITKNK